MIALNSAAPDFSLPSITADGPRHFTLSENFGKTHTLLLFFPMAFTGVCTQEMCAISQNYSEYTTLGATVYGISGDNPFAQAEWAKKEGITLRLLSDYEHHVARAYGLAYDSFLPQIHLGMGGVPKRSAILVDKDGFIQYIQINDDAHDLPDFAKIQARLKELA